MIAPEGWPFAVIPLLAGAVVWFVGWPVFGVFLMALGVFALVLLQKPATRSVSSDPGTACAPADGKVIKICPAPR